MGHYLLRPKEGRRGDQVHELMHPVRPLCNLPCRLGLVCTCGVRMYVSGLTVFCFARGTGASAKLAKAAGKAASKATAALINEMLLMRGSSLPLSVPLRLQKQKA